MPPEKIMGDLVSPIDWNGIKDVQYTAYYGTILKKIATLNDDTEEITFVHAANLYDDWKNTQEQMA